ncbi:hypothetical protein ACFVR1_00775 [Psychrobacillus sp. NPDC058041]|uniref:hypothetical protein n=1 Tax=Psychrobacillus sp. NPDC058041 TaxID=3346310 RepID=UPI0036DC512A
MLEENFWEVLCAHKKMKIGIYLSDNQFVEGILLDVKQDHLVVDVNRNIIYLAINNIQALSKNAKEFSASPNLCSYLDRNDLTDVLIALRYNWVTINSLSNDALNGVLTTILQDHIILINSKDLLFISKSYIANIYSNLSIDDIHFLNNKEQLNIQQIYKANINKTLEIKEHCLESSQEKALQNYVFPMNDELAVQLDPILEEGKLVHQKERQVGISHIETLINVNTEVIKEPLESNLDSNFNTVPNLTHNNEEPVDHEAFFQLEETEDLKKDVQTAIYNNEMNVEELNSNSTAIIETNLSQLDTSDFIKSDEEVIQKINSHEILKNNSATKQEQLIQENTRLNHRGKKILLTAWSALNSDQSTIPIPKRTTPKSENPVQQENSTNIEDNLENELTNKSISSDKQKNVDEVSSVNGKTPLAEKILFSRPVKLLSAKEEREMLEKQYFALMKYAANKAQKLIRLQQQSVRTNSINYQRFNKSKNNIEYSDLPITLEKNKIHQSTILNKEADMMEKQYYSLMMHAAKMYYQVREHQLEIKEM